MNIEFDNATVSIDQVTFDSNSAGEGGGFWISAGVNGVVFINNTKVKSNWAVNHGGGMFLKGQMNGTASVNISNVVIKNNMASEGSGGGIYSTSVSTYISGSADIASNTAHDGGGIALVEMIAGQISDVSVTENKADRNGGGVYLYNTNVAMEESKVDENDAQSGGGIYIYQDPSWRYQENLTSNSLLFRVSVMYNKAKGYGGGVYVNDSILQWIGSRFVDNMGKIQQQDSSVYCTPFAEENGYCSRCSCLGECDTCPDEGCSVNGNDCTCLVEPSLVKECDAYKLPSASVPDTGHKGIVYGLLFGLFVPLVAVAAFSGWIYYRWKKRRSYMALDQEEKSNTFHPL